MVFAVDHTVRDKPTGCSAKKLTSNEDAGSREANARRVVLGKVRAFLEVNDPPFCRVFSACFAEGDRTTAIERKGKTKAHGENRVENWKRRTGFQRATSLCLLLRKNSCATTVARTENANATNASLEIDHTPNLFLSFFPLSLSLPSPARLILSCVESRCSNKSKINGKYPTGFLEESVYTYIYIYFLFTVFR